jgi:RNA polymerase sigma-70 factor (ECF subfamily)
LHRILIDEKNEGDHMSTAFDALDDSKLIEMALAGEVECFAALMDRLIAGVKKRILGMVRSADDADDLLQEVQIKVWRHLSEFRSESSFRTWVMRVAINEVLQSYRREKRRAVCQPITDLDFFPSGGESPHQSAVRTETAATVHRAVVMLPPKYSQVLILRDLRELTERETAHSLELSIPAVKSRLLRARHMLLKALMRSTIQRLARAA